MKAKKIMLCLILTVAIVMSYSIVAVALPASDQVIIAETTDEAVDTPPPEEEPDPPSITIQNVPGSMEVGETATLSYTKKNTDNDNVSWKSSNTNVLSVDSGGKLTANAEGTAEITASLDGAEDSVNIRVNAVQPQSIKIVSNDFGLTSAVTGYEIKKGDVVKLEVEVEPDEATVSGITWEVSDPNLADIDSDGTLTALDNGVVTVIVTTDEGLTSELDITIGSSIPWIMIAIIAAVVLVIILLIILAVRKKMKDARKSRKNKYNDYDDDDDEDEDENDEDGPNEEDEKKKKEEELDRLRREAYEQGYKDREKEMTKVFNPRDFESGNDDEIE